MKGCPSPRSTGLILAAALLAAAGATARADDPTVDYLRDIKPIFKARCFACHGALKQQSGLRVDTAAAILKGSDAGPVLVPGNVEQSRLVERIAAQDESVRMPPEGMPLKPDEIARISAWIKAGARGPEKELPEPDPRDHWAFKLPARPPLPQVMRTDAAGNAIDAFIEAQLEAQGLSPRPPAEKHVLLRRVSLDLIGLPPTPDELRAFLSDNSPAAYETVIDRLLADPRYGERWGRHWMDVWRYSDWYGRRHVPDVWNSAPQIWRWRDWIVKSLNADHGYDRMLREMLAADELAPEDDGAAVATGYLIRNWYALNPNDWMRNTVEHTGKAFLGLTFNCAHCHDHKYDPIAQDDYFRLRAFFEPVYIRQDRVAGEGDPGPFQDYDYAKLRKIQRLGAVRIFDRTPDAPTWFYTGGDERNRMKDRTIAPGVPAFLAAGLPKIEPVELPPRAWYPGLRPAIQETVLAEARAAVAQAEAELAAARQSTPPPSPELQEQLAQAEAALAAATREAEAKGEPGALAGRQSLLLDATAGRRVVQNGLSQLKSLEDGSAFEFELLLLADAHVNFQLAKDAVKGLTAGYVAFDKGRIVSYQPGSFTEFEAGRYDFAAGQKRFRVKLVLETQADRMRLTVRSVKDDKVLVDAAPVALNGWNPVGDATKAMTFDARTGSVAAVDTISLLAPAAEAGSAVASARRASFDFEAPVYADGRDVAGLDGWSISPFSVAPATSVVSSAVGNEGLRQAMQKVEAARRTVRAPQLPLLAAEAKLSATRAELSSAAARIAADRAKFELTPGADAAALGREASRIERDAALRTADAAILAQERALADAEAKPAGDANRAKAVAAATAALAAARTAVENARAALSDEKRAETYNSFGPTYPRTSTGRRRALAECITSPQNPLTARVAVNHIWSHHFHAPLVASVYDFGRNGARPTHPELLDWLAVELMGGASEGSAPKAQGPTSEAAWPMKKIHRLIVTSAAYRRVSSAGDAKNAEADPENRLLWRMNSGRMEAEVVRDSLLSCAGLLDPRMGGQELENSEALTTFRRSLYYSIYPEDGGRNPLGELFDAPNPLECYRRTRSIVPQQALALTNSDLVHAMASAIVGQWKDDADPALTDGFVTAMFERTLSRRPTEAELRLCGEALARQRELLQKSNAAEELTRARESLVRALLNHNDFITIR